MRPKWKVGDVQACSHCCCACEDTLLRNLTTKGFHGSLCAVGWIRFYDRIFSTCLIIWCLLKVGKDHSNEQEWRVKMTLCFIVHSFACRQRSFAVCFKLTLICCCIYLFICLFYAEHILRPPPPLPSPRTLIILAHFTIPLWNASFCYFKHGQAFSFSAGVEVGASVTFQAQTVVSGGKEDFWRRSHGEQFRSLYIMYAVCMNYEPWKDFTVCYQGWEEKERTWRVKTRFFPVPQRCGMQPIACRLSFKPEHTTLASVISECVPNSLVWSPLLFCLFTHRQLYSLWDSDSKYQHIQIKQQRDVHI